MLSTFLLGSWTITGSNWALFGCSTSRTSDLSLFKIPSVGKADGDETKAKKETACKEWLRVVLQTRELTLDLKKRTELIICSCVNFILKQS